MSKNRIERMGRGIALALVATLMVFGGQSCMRDNLDDCFNVHLRVITDYEAAPGTRAGLPAPREWYEDQIDYLTVFVFDEQDRLVTTWTGGRYTLGQEYLVPLKLPENRKYRFVAWSGCDMGCYMFMQSLDELPAGSHLGELAVGLNIPEDRLITEDISHRLHGDLQQAEVNGSLANRHEIVMGAHTYKVNFIIVGWPGSDSFNVEVHDRNSQHDFSRRHIDGQDYYTHRRAMIHGYSEQNSRREIAASMVLLQIGDDTGTSFRIEKTATDPNGIRRADTASPEEGVFSSRADLLDAIKAGYDLTDQELVQRLEEQYEYDIIIRFAGLDLDFEVMPWNYKDNGGVLE